MLQMTCWSYARSHASLVMPYMRCSSPWIVQAKDSAAASIGTAGNIHHASARAREDAWTATAGAAIRARAYQGIIRVDGPPPIERRSDAVRDRPRLQRGRQRR